MCIPEAVLYTPLLVLLQTILGAPHALTTSAVADLVYALLMAQSLHSADLARGLPHLQTSKARQAMKRVRRIVRREVLASKHLTPLLIRVVLRLVTDAEVLLVLDSTRCIRWEIFTLGVRIGGRVLPIAWAILAYPWPVKTFTPTVVSLLDRTLAAWPKDRVVHLVADRGFPSNKLFQCLDSHRERLALDYTIRLRASDYIYDAAGLTVKVGDRMQGVVVGTWRIEAARYRKRQRAVATAWLVVGREEHQPAAHQRGPADQARRAARAARRIAHIRSKHQNPTTDRVWGLFTTKAVVSVAVQAYAGRFATEGTYRDLKSWDLEAVAGHETDMTALDGLLGAAALGYLVQAAIGVAASRASEDWARVRQGQWCTTDRLSSFWRGRQVLHDHAVDWLPWLDPSLLNLTHQLGTGNPPGRSSRQPAAHVDRQEAA